MAEIKRGDPFEEEMLKIKRRLTQTEIVFRALVNQFRDMPPKDRARNISQIQQGLRIAQKFIEGVKLSQIHNVGAKFAFENLKGSYFVLLGRWRKFERTI